MEEELNPFPCAAALRLIEKVKELKANYSSYNTSDIELCQGCTARQDCLQCVKKLINCKVDGAHRPDEHCGSSSHYHLLPTDVFSKE